MGFISQTGSRSFPASGRSGKMGFQTSGICCRTQIPPISKILDFPHSKAAPKTKQIGNFGSVQIPRIIPDHPHLSKPDLSGPVSPDPSFAREFYDSRIPKDEERVKRTGSCPGLPVLGLGVGVKDTLGNSASSTAHFQRFFPSFIYLFNIREQFPPQP